MKDCSSCKKVPQAGSRYEDTPCCRCTPYEPSNNRMGAVEQKPTWWWSNYDQRKAQGLDRTIRL